MQPAQLPSQPGSQYGDLGELLGRAVAVLGQPADVSEASQRPPCSAYDADLLSIADRWSYEDVEIRDISLT